MEFELDQQVTRPITNEVEVLNGASYRDVVLQPRIKPLLEAETVGQLLGRLDSVKQSFETFGAAPAFAFGLAGAKPAGSSPSDVLALKTVVDLTRTRPDHSAELSSRIARDRYNLEGRWKASNRLGLGELFQLSAQAQPNPYSLAAGSASVVSPVPLGRSLFHLKGFFFNEDRKWASHSLASHGVAADLRVPLASNLVFRGGAQAIARNVHSISEKAGDVVRAAAGSSSLKVSAIAELSNTGACHSARAFFEAAGQPGDTQHLKSVAELAYTLPLTKTRAVVLDVEGRAGYIHSDDEKPKLCDNFLIGGPESVLGFKRYSLGPRDAGDFIGGQAFYTARATLLSRLPFHKVSPLRLKAQADAGVLRAHSAADWRSNVQDLAASPASASASAGLAYASERAKFDVLWVVPLRSSPSDILQPGLHVGAELNLV